MRQPQSPEAAIITDDRSAQEPDQVTPVGTILVAEDEGRVRDEISRILHTAGHEVAAVANGREALEEMRRRRPDVVLSDVDMPGLDGPALLRQMRADTDLRDVPVVLLVPAPVADAAPIDPDPLADDSLCKPIAPRALLTRIRTQLRIARLREDAVRERRALIERLQQSETRLGALADAAPALLWMSDRDQRRVWMNNRWTGFTGRTLDQMLGAGWRQDVHPDDLPRLDAALAAHTERASAFRVEYRLRRADGAWRWHDDTAVPRYEADGAFAGFLGSLADVTQARETEAALQARPAPAPDAADRDAEYEQVWQLSQDLLLVADDDGRLLRVSPSWTRLLGHDEARLRELSLGLLHPDDVAALLATVQRMRRDGQPARLENRLLGADGLWHWIAWALSPSPVSARVFGVGRDVTPERAGREAALAQERERERIAAALNQVQRLEAVGRLTGGVAHDFNNLLTVIQGNIEHLGRRLDDPRAQVRLGRMRAAVGRGATLTSQLLAFSRKQLLTPRPLNLGDVVGGMADLLRSTLGGAARLDIATEPDMWPALVDHAQLELVLLNLVINARDAMPRGGTLRILTANAVLGPPRRAEDPAAGEYAKIAVSDTGTGMPPEVLERAMEPFFTTKEPGTGSGLGLAQVYGFAKQSGGGLRLDSAPGQGTTVEVYLPRSAAAAPAPETPSAPAGLPPTVGATRVLLVDDDADVREATRTTLVDLGCRVTEAGHGLEALERLEAGAAFDLLVLDFAMPGMTGGELAHAVQARHPGLAIVLVTGYAEAAALPPSWRWPIVAKPFRRAQLAEALRRALATRPQAPG